MAKLPRGIHTEIECLRLDFHVCMTWQSSHIIVRWNPWKSSLRHSISNRGFFKFIPLSAVSLSLSLSLSFISPKNCSHPLTIPLKKSQSPPAPSVANLRLRGPRHHRPAPASVNAAHRISLQKIPATLSNFS